MDGGNLGWWVPALVLGVPPFLLLLLHLLAHMEAWMLQPDERAAAVRNLLEQAEGPDEVETAVIRLLAGVEAGTRRVDGVPAATAPRLRLRNRLVRASPPAAAPRRRAS